MKAPPTNDADCVIFRYSGDASVNPTRMEYIRPRALDESTSHSTVLCHFVELRRSEDVWTTSDDVLSAEISIMYRRLKAVIFLVRTVGLRDRSIDADIEVLNLLDAECSITQHTERDLKMSTHPQIIINRQNQ